MGFRLSIEQGHGRGEAFDFTGEATIGRADSNDIVIAEGGVSRHHASIYPDEGRWVIHDEGTSNGTFLNGSRIETEYLEEGDVIAIGSVQLRFESMGAPAGGATRIVSLPAGDPDGTRPGVLASEVSGRPSAARSGGLSDMDPKKKKLIFGAAGGVVALGALAFFMGGDSGGSSDACPDEIQLKEGLRDFTFGQGVEADCQAGEKLTFVFGHVARSRAILSYSPFFVESGELGIYVNDVKVADVPLSPGQRPIRRELVLPDRALIEGQSNKVELRDEGGDGAWGVKLVELDVIALGEADLEKALRAYELGKRRYREKNVAAPNLYQAWEHLREARRFMEGLEPKPSDYEPTIALIRDVERELDKLCRERLFAAQNEAKYDRYNKANDIYKFLIAAFPGDRHECRALAKQRMWDE